LVPVACSDRLSSLAEHLEVANTLIELRLFNVLVDTITLVELAFSLFHGSECFFVVSVFIDLHLGARVIEVGQGFKCLSFGVERNNGLHDFRVVMPVLVLKEIARKHIHLRVSCVGCEANHCLYISRLKQTLDTLHLLVGHRVDLSTQLELTLLLNELGQTHEDIDSVFL